MGRDGELRVVAFIEEAGEASPGVGTEDGPAVQVHLRGVAQAQLHLAQIGAQVAQLHRLSGDRAEAQTAVGVGVYKFQHPHQGQQSAPAVEGIGVHALSHAGEGVVILIAGPFLLPGSGEDLGAALRQAVGFLLEAVALETQVGEEVQRRPHAPPPVHVVPDRGVLLPDGGQGSRRPEFALVEDVLYQTARPLRSGNAGHQGIEAGGGGADKAVFPVAVGVKSPLLVPEPLVDAALEGVGLGAQRPGRIRVPQRPGQLGQGLSLQRQQAVEGHVLHVKGVCLRHEAGAVVHGAVVHGGLVLGGQLGALEMAVPAVGGAAVLQHAVAVAVPVLKPPQMRPVQGGEHLAYQGKVVGQLIVLQYDIAEDGRLGAVHPLGKLRHEAGQVPGGDGVLHAGADVAAGGGPIAGPGGAEGVVEHVVQPEEPAAELLIDPETGEGGEHPAVFEVGQGVPGHHVPQGLRAAAEAALLLQGFSRPGADGVQRVLLQRQGGFRPRAGAGIPIGCAQGEVDDRGLLQVIEEAAVLGPGSVFQRGVIAQLFHAAAHVALVVGQALPDGAVLQRHRKAVAAQGHGDASVRRAGDAAVPLEPDGEHGQKAQAPFPVGQGAHPAPDGPGVALPVFQLEYRAVVLGGQTAVAAVGVVLIELDVFAEGEAGVGAAGKAVRPQRHGQPGRQKHHGRRTFGAPGIKVFFP